jgi:hypothetical protein
MSLDDFLANYGGYLEGLVAVAKDTTGRAFYPSKVAPADDNYPTFFSDLVDTIKTVGIPLSAYINVFADAFFAADSDYQTLTAAGEPLSNIVCPNKPKFLQHMTAIIKEVARYPIQSVFLAQLGYANSGFCYCKDCRSEFSDFADLRHEIPVVDPSANRTLYDTWIGWRGEKMSDILRQLVKAAKESKPDLRVIPTYPIDSETGYAAGTQTNLGLEVEAAAQVDRSLALEVLPWTPILPEPGTRDFRAYVDSLSFVPKMQKAGVELAMTYWSIADETEYGQAKALADAVGIRRMYTMLDYPTGYQGLREARLGLGR